MTRILVTGATDGIGKQTALELVRRGAEVVLHGRNEQKAKAAAHDVARARSGAVVSSVWGDLSSLGEVRALAEQVERVGAVDVLLHNAGLYAKRREVTVDGFELTFAVNHLAPFVLTHLLLPELRARPKARIVFVASMVHQSAQLDFDDLQLERGFDGYRAYAASKLMNVMTAFALARRLEGTAITANALHPGVIGTKLLRSGFGSFGGSVESGARTSVKLAVDPSLEGVTGRYFSDEREVPSSRASHDRAAQERLYAVSCALGGVAPI